MDIKKTLLAYLLFLISITRADDTWSFLKPPDMKAFFTQQRDKVEQAFTSGYQEAKRMKDSVNNYVETVKEKSRKVSDAWSFFPTDDSDSRLENPDVTLSVPGIISQHGYICETHNVVSQGYLLSLHRIPRSKTGKEVPLKTVYLQHGLFASSADWIINGPEKGLAYVLADAGYDVWMGNIRGNKYSREHTWLKPDSKAYWNFSWHDVAQHDIPAIIDYILKIKEGASITYIGHSMGTTILFAMLSLRPEYNDVLSGGIALAPVVFMSDLKSPLKSLAPITNNVASMEMLYGSYEFIPKHSTLGRTSSSCQVDNMDAVVCKNIIFYICGYDEKQFNKTLLPVFLTHLGTGTSWKTAVHFAQEINSGGNFQQFDYGSYYNKVLYGSESPPAYDLSKITLPISLFWAKNDLLSSEKDVRMLYERLPSTTEIYEVPFEEFNHLDYLWAVDAPSLVNDKVLDTLRRYQDKDTNLFEFGIKFV